MKKLLLLLFVLSASIVHAQYFDWNQVFFSMTNPGGWTHYNDFQVAKNGNQIVRYSFSPCLMCSAETIECTVDQAGAVTSAYNTFLNGYRQSYYDRNSNLIRVTKNGSDYNLQYFLTDTMNLFLNDSAPIFVSADGANNLYLFYSSGSSTRVSLFDSTGAFKKTMLLTGTTFKVSESGCIYMCQISLLLNSAFVTRYNNSGSALGSYLFSYSPDLSLLEPDFEPTKTTENVWGQLNNNIVCYDSSGVIIYSIPVIDNEHVSLAVDDSDNIVAWEGNGVYKYHQNSLLWNTNIDAALTEKINVDGNGNIYYISNYSEPLFDLINGNFIPTSFAVPPAVAFKGYLSDPGPNADLVFNVVLGKISNAPLSSFNIYTAAVIENDVPVNTLCTRNNFDVRINFDHLPIENTMDTVFIELSDASGSFNDPLIIGFGRGLLIPCNIPDIVSPGTSYLIRSRLENNLVTSLPYSQNIAIKSSPQPSVFLDNSIEDNYSCQPCLLKANPDQNLAYDWFSVTDPFFAPVFNFFSQHDSLITLPVNSYEAVGVIVTNVVNGCAATSSFITPYELDQSNPLDLRMFFPDTVHVNDIPFEVRTPGLLIGTVTGPGIYSGQQGVGGFYFYPDSVHPGKVTLQRSLHHQGNPCIPYSFGKNIFVDGTPRNIITNAVDPLNHTACIGDTIEVPFSILNPSKYDSTNTFVVQLLDDDPNNNKITLLDIIGSGKSSPVKCVFPNRHGNNFRFRIRATQTGELSTLNSDGNLSIPVYPYVSLQGNFFTTNCIPTNYPLNIYSSFGEHQWFLNNQLILDSTDWNVGIIPTTSGTYNLKITDPDNGCTVRLGPIEANDSAHIPYLTTDPPSYYLYSCGKTFPLITAHTDSVSSLSWYFGENLLPVASDSLLPSISGLFKAVATSVSGCILSVFDPKFIYADPLIQLDVPLTSTLCNNDSIQLSVNNDYTFFGYNYLWYKDNNPITTSRQLVVSDSGYYNVVVSSSSGCNDTSEKIYINTSIINPPTVSPAGPSIINLGQGVALNTAFNTDYSYQWYKYDKPINKANKRTYFAIQSGLYKVAITNSAGCSATSNTVEVIQTRRYVHIQPSENKVATDNDSAPSLTIFPNPGNGKFVLNADKLDDERVILCVTDLLGRVIIEKVLTPVNGSLHEQISIPSSENGIYYVKTELSHYTMIMPLVVIH